MKYIFVFFLFISQLSVAQNTTIEDIAKDYCENSSSIKWDKNSKKKIVVQIATLSEAIKKKHQHSLLQIEAKYKKKNPNTSVEDIKKKVAEDFAYYLIDSCDTYINNSRQLLSACPKTNKSLEIATKTINNKLAQTPNLSYQEKDELVRNTLFDFTFGNDELIEKDYKDGIGHPEFTKDIAVYLYHHSIEAYKAFLMHQTMSILKGQ